MSLRDLFFPGGAANEALSGEADPNVQFYQNKLASKPDGALVDDMHKQWDGDFERLEMHHGYIQWIFPVFENAGMNFESKPLSKSGAAIIRADPAAQQRVIQSYRMMLKFYGLALADESSGALERHSDERLYKTMMGNLNQSSHNWLRVSRIITSLGELGFRRYKKPLIEALRKEVDAGALSNAAQSLDNFWAPLVEAEGTPRYNAKTLEEEADRAEGCLFQPGGALAGAGSAEGEGPAAAHETAGTAAGGASS